MTNVSPTAISRNGAVVCAFSDRSFSVRNLPGASPVKIAIMMISAANTHVSPAASARRTTWGPRAAAAITDVPGAPEAAVGRAIRTPPW